MSNILKIIGLVVVLIVIGIGILLLSKKNQNQPSNLSYKGKAVIYKSPTCGCCVQYGKYMEQNGYQVETVMTENMQAVKNKYNITAEMESCHTMVIEDKVVEGHVPIEVVESYLADSSMSGPIALPDMPSGSPGMPGKKRGPFRIYALTGGEAEVYLDF